MADWTRLVFMPDTTVITTQVRSSTVQINSRKAATAVFVTCDWWLVLAHAPSGGLPYNLYHPLLVALGVACIVQGILVVQYASQQERQQALTLHQVFLVGLALPLMGLGSYAMWYAHSLPGREHFVSWHGVIGFGLMCVIVLQILGGISIVWFGTSIYGSENKAKAMYKYHRYVSHTPHTTYKSISGYAIGSVLSVQLFLAFWELPYTRLVTPTPVAIIGTASVCIMLYGITRGIHLAKLGFT